MISEDTKRIKIGDFIFIWSEEAGGIHHGPFFYTNIIIWKGEEELKVVPITDDCFLEIQNMKKSIVSSRENYRILGDIEYTTMEINYHDRRRYHYIQSNISKHYISWYQIENSINME